jgi:hypothetical protein
MPKVTNEILTAVFTVEREKNIEQGLLLCSMNKAGLIRILEEEGFQYAAACLAVFPFSLTISRLRFNHYELKQYIKELKTKWRKGHES